MKFFMEDNETIVYRLGMRNPEYVATFKFLDFLGSVLMDLATSNIVDAKGSGAMKLTKWMYLLGQAFSRNNFFEIFEV